MANALGSTLQRIQQQEERANVANLQRYGEIMAIMDEMVARARPGGAFERRGLAEIERQKVKGVGRETQQLISSGLYGTTTMAGAGRRWEAEVGGPARLTLEDIQQQRLSEAQISKAGFMERREDIGPDPGMIAQLAAQAGQMPTGPTGPSAYEQRQQRRSTERMQEEARRSTEYMQSQQLQASKVARQEAAREAANLRARGAGGTQADFTPTVRGEYGTYYGAAGREEQVAPAKYGPPTPYYEAGGGWADWEATGGEKMPAGFKKKGEPMIMAAKRWSKRKQPATYGQFAGGGGGQFGGYGAQGTW